jgi:hypothetical protein
LREKHPFFRVGGAKKREGEWMLGRSSLTPVTKTAGILSRSNWLKLQFQALAQRGVEQSGIVSPINLEGWSPFEANSFPFCLIT